jgi:hypothetical protein
MLLSWTKPHDIPGMSLSVCICLSCRRSIAAEPSDEDVDMSCTQRESVEGRGEAPPVVWLCGVVGDVRSSLGRKRLLSSSRRF